MMIFSLVAMTGLEKCCITSAYLQWLCHSGERPVTRGPLVNPGSAKPRYVEFANGVDPELIWICTVCHYVCDFLSITWIN